MSPSPTPQGRNRLPSLTPRLKGDNWVIQFSYKGDQKYLSFGTGKTGKTAANATANRILGDLQTGNFDPTLDKYRSAPKLIQKQDENDSHSLSTLELWDRWVESLNLSERTQSGHYQSCRRTIEESCPEIDQSNWLLTIECAASTWNRKRTMLYSCFDWGLKKGLVAHNPYSELKARKQSKNREKRKPFNQSEVQLIIEGFKASKTYSHYLDFVLFLLTTGVRPSEAIGLQMKHVDFSVNEIKISDSLSRDERGRSSGKNRVRKETKTSNIRILSIPPSLLPMLQEKQGYFILIG
jgi:integrase